MLSTIPRISPVPTAARYRNLARPTTYLPGMDLAHPSLPVPEGGIEVELPEDVLGRRKINYDMVMLHGKRGDGKSTLMTAAAKRILKIWQSLHSHHLPCPIHKNCARGKIFTNYKCDFATTAHPRLVDWLLTYPEQAHDCLVLIDEIALQFPSLRANSREQLNWQSFCQLIRKLHISIMCTTQYPTYVGAATNIQINWYIKPHLYNWHYYAPVRQWVADSIDFDVVDWHGSQSGFPIFHRWPPMPQDAMFRKSLHNISEIYTEFDTDELIPPMWVPNRNQIMERSWKPEMDAEMDQLEQIRRVQAEARATVAETQPDVTTMDEWLETQKVLTAEKPVALNMLVESAKGIDKNTRRDKLKILLVDVGFTVAKIGALDYVQWQK